MRTPLKKSSLLLCGVALMLMAGCSTQSAEPSPSATGGDTESASPTPTGQPPAASTSPVDGQCTSGELAPSIQDSTLDPGTGIRTITVVLTNISTTASCTLQGWPGVSFVQGDAGAQLGAAAEQNTDSPNATVTLDADGGATTFGVTLVPYADEECDPRDASGIRIYPPGETEALFIDGTDQGLVGCASESFALLTTGALQPGG